MKCVPHFVTRFYGTIEEAGCPQTERLLPNREFVFYVSFNGYESLFRRLRGCLTIGILRKLRFVEADDRKS